jgi:hypothetical protein
VDVDDLYGLPLDHFVPERTALARELRKAGNRDEASEVAALKKPSVAAWAVNQLVRTQRKAIDELLEAGEGLRSAQDDVLAGRGDARSLRAAVERERLAVQELTESARGLLSSEGHELSDTIVERVADTLHAAALDDEAREQVSSGRLERELRHVGLGGLGAFSGEGSPAPRPEKRAEKRASSRPRKTDSDGKRKSTQAGERAEQERSVREQAKAEEETRRAARATEREARRRVGRGGGGAERVLERSGGAPRGRGRPRGGRGGGARRGGRCARRGGGRSRDEPVAQRSSATTITTITSTTRTAPPIATGRWRHQNSGSARSRV